MILVVDYQRDFSRLSRAYAVKIAVMIPEIPGNTCGEFDLRTKCRPALELSIPVHNEADVFTSVKYPEELVELQNS